MKLTQKPLQTIELRTVMEEKLSSLLTLLRHQLYGLLLLEVDTEGVKLYEGGDWTNLISSVQELLQPHIINKFQYYQEKYEAEGDPGSLWEKVAGLCKRMLYGKKSFRGSLSLALLYIALSQHLNVRLQDHGSTFLLMLPEAIMYELYFQNKILDNKDGVDTEEKKQELKECMEEYHQFLKFMIKTSEWGTNEEFGKVAIQLIDITQIGQVFDTILLQQENFGDDAKTIRELVSAYFVHEKHLPLTISLKAFQAACAPLMREYGDVTLSDLNAQGELNNVRYLFISGLFYVLQWSLIHAAYPVDRKTFDAIQNILLTGIARRQMGNDASDSFLDEFTYSGKSKNQKLDFAKDSQNGMRKHEYALGKSIALEILGVGSRHYIEILNGILEANPSLQEHVNLTEKNADQCLKLLQKLSTYDMAFTEGLAEKFEEKKEVFNEWKGYVKSLRDVLQELGVFILLRNEALLDRSDVRQRLDEFVKDQDIGYMNEYYRNWLGGNKQKAKNSSSNSPDARVPALEEFPTEKLPDLQQAVGTQLLRMLLAPHSSYRHSIKPKSLDQSAWWRTPIQYDERHHRKELLKLYTLPSVTFTNTRGAIMAGDDQEQQVSLQYFRYVLQECNTAIEVFNEWMNTLQTQYDLPVQMMRYVESLKTILGDYDEYTHVDKALFQCHIYLVMITLWMRSSDIAPNLLTEYDTMLYALYTSLYQEALYIVPYFTIHGYGSFSETTVVLPQYEQMLEDEFRSGKNDEAIGYFISLYRSAVQSAKEEDKTMLAYFTGIQQMIKSSFDFNALDITIHTTYTESGPTSLPDIRYATDTGATNGRSDVYKLQPDAIPMRTGADYLLLDFSDFQFVQTTGVLTCTISIPSIEVYGNTKHEMRICGLTNPDVHLIIKCLDSTLSRLEVEKCTIGDFYCQSPELETVTIKNCNVQYLPIEGLAKNLVITGSTIAELQLFLDGDLFSDTVMLESSTIETISLYNAINKAGRYGGFVWLDKTTISQLTFNRHWNTDQCITKDECLQPSEGWKGNFYIKVNEVDNPHDESRSFSARCVLPDRDKQIAGFYDAIAEIDTFQTDGIELPAKRSLYFTLMQIYNPWHLKTLRTVAKTIANHIDDYLSNQDIIIFDGGMGDGCFVNILFAELANKYLSNSPVTYIGYEQSKGFIETAKQVIEPQWQESIDIEHGDMLYQRTHAPIQLFCMSRHNLSPGDNESDFTERCENMPSGGLLIVFDSFTMQPPEINQELIKERYEKALLHKSMLNKLFMQHGSNLNFHAFHQLVVEKETELAAGGVDHRFTRSAYRDIAEKHGLVQMHDHTYSCPNGRYGVLVFTKS